MSDDHDGPAIPRTFTPIGPSDVDDSQLMLGILRSIRQEMMSENQINRERHQRLLERIDALALDVETHFQEQERRLATLEESRRRFAARK